MENEHTHVQTAKRGLQFQLDRLSSMEFPNHPGYSFDEWVTKQENADETLGTDQQTSNEVAAYEDGAQVTFLNNTDLYATWTPISYPITYNMNYPQAYTGVEQSEPSDALHEYTIQDQYQPNPPFNITGYDFSGWTPEMIHKGTTGAITFTANWIESTGNEWNIEYDKTCSSAEFPANLLVKYSPSTVIPDTGYQPGSMESVSATVVNKNTYSDQGNSYTQREVRKYTFRGWSPDKLHKYRTGDMKFSGNWLKRYTSRFDHRGILTNCGILGQLATGTYTLSFGTSNWLMMSHAGDSLHTAVVYLHVIARQKIDSAHIYHLDVANIPIPKSCIKLKSTGNQPTGDKWGEKTITTPVTKTSGITNEYLNVKTFTYQFNGKENTPLFSITNVPVTIPACGSVVPTGVLQESGTYRYPNLSSFDSSKTIDYIIVLKVDEPSGCKGMSIQWDESSSNNNILLNQYVPVKTHVVYSDGTSEKISSETIGENTFDIQRPIKSITIGNMVTTITGTTSWGSAKEIILTMGVKTIGENGFSTSVVENLVIPENVTSIGNRCFASCQNLRLLAIESPLSAYQGSIELFTDCPNLNTLYLDNCTTTQYLANADQWWGGSGITGGTPPANLRVICRDGEIYNGQIVN